MDKPNIGVLAGRLYELLKDLDPEDRARVVGATMVLFGEQTPVSSAQGGALPIDQPVSRELKFSSREDITPKQFLFEKRPNTDVERVGCLAFYLTHYRDTRHFKTVDISKLNTEAAQIKLSNAAKAVNNAATKGFITPSAKGNKQISSLGEEYVSALPNRDAAKKAFERFRPRKRRSRASKPTRKSRSS